jgi:predicted protein tyrosine phosphatase
MYKRPVRILFLAGSGNRRTQTATRLTADIGAGWMEARGASVEDVGSGALAWADLVVLLDADSRRRCPALPATARLKSLDLPDDPSEGGEAIIRKRIHAMLGGLRMLSRLDEQRDEQD